jgi:hypothetical protein
MVLKKFLACDGVAARRSRPAIIAFGSTREKGSQAAVFKTSSMIFSRCFRVAEDRSSQADDWQYRHHSQPRVPLDGFPDTAGCSPEIAA